MSCVIPIPRLPKPHSCFPTDPDSICLPPSVLTVPLGLLYSAVVPKGAFSIRDQHKPPNPLVSTLGSNWHGAQARWFNANHHRLKPLVRLRFCQWSSTPTFLLVSILTETSPLVTNPVSTRWSPPGLLIGVVLKLSGSISARAAGFT